LRRTYIDEVSLTDHVRASAISKLREFRHEFLHVKGGRKIARQYAQHDRWSRLAKRLGAAGEFATGSEPSEPGLFLD
jgi:hypothetical protein